MWGGLYARHIGGRIAHGGHRARPTQRWPPLIRRNHHGPPYRLAVTATPADKIGKNGKIGDFCLFFSKIALPSFFLTVLIG